jgi:hypothetical protein
VIIVVDTNVFVRETHLLRKKGGPALLRLLRVTKGQILIPEILRREYLEQTIKAAGEEGARIETASSMLRTLLGGRLEHPVPDSTGVRASALERLCALEALTISEPLSAVLHVAAGERTLANRRPCSKTDHGYKDCLIWESVLRLPAGSEVRFVSRDDKAFFSGDAFHPDLIAEAREREIAIIGYREIERVVKELAEANPSLDLAALEAQELDAQSTEPVDEPVSAARIPLTAQAKEDQQKAGGDASEVTYLLAEAQKGFDGLDLKVLAYIAYFDTATKTEVYGALAQSGVAPDMAKNIAERLVINGIVRDTGNHYLVEDRAIGNQAAATAEQEIIELLTASRRVDGK